MNLFCNHWHVPNSASLPAFLQGMAICQFRKQLLLNSLNFRHIASNIKSPIIKWLFFAHLQARIKAKPLIKVTYPRNGYRYRNPQHTQDPQMIQQQQQPAQQQPQTETQQGPQQTPQFQVQPQVPMMPTMPGYGQQVCISMNRQTDTHYENLVLFQCSLTESIQYHFNRHPIYYCQ